MTILFHGTTLRRAEQTLERGPDPDFIEPGDVVRADGVFMKTAASPIELLRRALLSPDRGIVGLVDDLLAICQRQDLQFDWEDGRCRVRSPEEESEELLNVPLRRSAFRAILARVAVLCKEQNPNSASPYGGQAEITVPGGTPVVLRVAFTNTPGKQNLRVVRMPPGTPEKNGPETPPAQETNPTPPEVNQAR